MSEGEFKSLAMFFGDTLPLKLPAAGELPVCSPFYKMWFPPEHILI